MRSIRLDVFDMVTAQPYAVFMMQKKPTITREIISWGALIVFSFSTIFLMFLLLTNLPNPIPIIILFIGYGIFAYIFRAQKAKLLSLSLFLAGTIWLMVGMMDTKTVSLKCSPDLIKTPENRNMEAVDLETKNFDSCLKSITFLDNVKYGLLQ